MSNRYYLVHSSILPQGIEKVIECRNLVEHQHFKITDACKIAGISRNKYYKYKDLVFVPNENASKVIKISLKLSDKTGKLSAILHLLSLNDANVVTINQEAPIDGFALINLTVDVKEMGITIDELIQLIKKEEGASSVKLLAIN